MEVRSIQSRCTLHMDAATCCDEYFMFNGYYRRFSLEPKPLSIQFTMPVT